jgi:protein gp37
VSTGIEWTDETWNPTTGCDRVSPGCDNCYALGMAKRLKAMGQADYQTDGDPKTSGPGFGIAMHPDRLEVPLRWRKPRKVFVNSMSDLFHKGVTADFIARVFAVMAHTPQHTYQILTKRHDRMRSLLSNADFRDDVISWLRHWGQEWDSRFDNTAEDVTDGMWPLPNVWLGVSVEDQKWADIRIPALLETPAAVRFLSCEPLLGPVSLFDNTKIDTGTLVDWVIVGGESGPRARPMHPDWARQLRYECTTYGIPFLFKQWGEWAPARWKGEGGATHAFTGSYLDENTAHFMELSHQPTSLARSPQTPRGAQGMTRPGKHAAGRELDGSTWDQYPTTPSLQEAQA